MDQEQRLEERRKEAKGLSLKELVRDIRIASEQAEQARVASLVGDDYYRTANQNNRALFWEYHEWLVVLAAELSKRGVDVDEVLYD